MSAESLIFEAIAIFILILINGFLSSAELAIVSAKRSVIDNMAKDGVAGAATVAGMKENPEKFCAKIFLKTIPSTRKAKSLPKSAYSLTKN